MPLEKDLGLVQHWGRPKGQRTCDFWQVIIFLSAFRKQPMNVYQIYHYKDGGRLFRFDHKKLYRYLRWCMKFGLVELDHVREGGFLPAKFYRLTVKGQSLLELMQLDPWLRQKTDGRAGLPAP